MREPRALGVTVAGGLLAAGLIGCPGTEDEPPPPSPPTGCIAPARVLDDGSCIEPGVQDNGCVAGSLRVDEDCVAPGVLRCAEGFELVDEGCRPILPAETCAVGQMAIPGDTACRPVAACPAGKWGDLPVDASTQYVDPTFVGTSDGSEMQPWTTIADAVAAAPSGALVALAAGSYEACELDIESDLRLAGVCPEQVEIGCSQGPYAMAAIGSEVEMSGFSLNGTSLGIVLGTDGVVVARELWIRDAVIGFLVQQDSRLELSQTLIENSSQGVALLGGGEATVSESHIRDLIPIGPNGLTAAVSANAEDGDGPSTATLTRSLVERAGGVYVAGSRLTVSESVLRNTRVDSPLPQNNRCLGAVTAVVDEGGGAELEVFQSVIEDAEGTGIRVFGSTATVSDTTIRGVRPGLEFSGQGFVDDLSTSSLERVLIEDVTTVGLRSEGSTTTCTACLVRDVSAGPDGSAGYGMLGLPVTDAMNVGTQLTVRNSQIVDIPAVGILGVATDLEVEATLVQPSEPSPVAQARGIVIQGDLGRGIAASLALRTSVVNASRQLGVGVFGAEATLANSVIVGANEGVAPDGDGLVVVGAPGVITNVILDGVFVSDVVRTGLAVHGATVDATRSRICARTELVSLPLEGLSSEIGLGDQVSCGCVDTGPCRVTEEGAPAPAPSIDTESGGS